MKNQIIILLTILFICQPLKGQNSEFYYKYDFKSYLRLKTKNPDKYVHKIQETIKYLAIARENKIEGRLEFLLINEGNNQSEIILKNHGLRSENKNFNEFYLPYVGFEREVKSAFKQVDAELLNENKEKFITEFTVLFEMEASKIFSEEDRTVDFLVIGKNVTVIESH